MECVSVFRPLVLPDSTTPGRYTIYFVIYSPTGEHLCCFSFGKIREGSCEHFCTRAFIYTCVFIALCFVLRQGSPGYPKAAQAGLKPPPASAYLPIAEIIDVHCYTSSLSVLSFLWVTLVQEY